MPTPEILRNDAYVNLFFLLNNDVFYSKPVDDPWFEAKVQEQTLVVGLTTTPSHITTYQTSEPVSVVGCTTQWSWCNPGSPGFCTKPTIPRMSLQLAQDIGFNPEQTSLFNRITSAFAQNIIMNVGSTVGNRALLATALATEGASNGLPSDQWIRELNQFFGAGIVASQVQISRFPTGDGYPSSSQNLAPVEPSAQWMCTNQVIQRDDFTSFRMVGVIIILVVGGAFIVFDLISHPLTNFILKKKAKSTTGRTKQGSFQTRNWIYSSRYHAQAYAYRMLGVGNWKTEGPIPTTEAGEQFETLWTRFENDDDGHGEKDKAGTDLEQGDSHSRSGTLTVDSDTKT